MSMFDERIIALAKSDIIDDPDKYHLMIRCDEGDYV